MKSKLLEIRDSGTRIPVLATRLCPTPYTKNERASRANHDAEIAILHDEGYIDKSGDGSFVMVTKLSDQTSAYEPFGWLTSARTMRIAHKEIAEKFDQLESGDVVDVEFVLGETKTKKTSEYATMFL
jgi:hypothetical protein